VTPEELRQELLSLIHGWPATVQAATASRADNWGGASEVQVLPGPPAAHDQQKCWSSFPGRWMSRVPDQERLPGYHSSSCQVASGALLGRSRAERRAALCLLSGLLVGVQTRRCVVQVARESRVVCAGRMGYDYRYCSLERWGW
jgi:hypothetical protein